MAQVKNYPKLAADILKEVNGKENIVNVSRCATRLRLVFKGDTSRFKRENHIFNRCYYCC